MSEPEVPIGANHVSQQLERTPPTLRALLCGVVAVLMAPGAALGSDEDLARQLANPISSLISLPFQGNFNDNIAPRRMAAR